jgi:predicted MFS family arabinose efflux permease
MKKRNVSSNVWKIYVIKAIRSGMFSIPIITLFFKENGLSVGEIFLLQALFSISVIILEVPTGYFADHFSRKSAIAIGSVMATMGYILYSMSYTFSGFLLAETILGVGVSFVSGADNAMLYDTLIEKEKEKEYMRIGGKKSSLGMISEGVTSIIGGFLALVSLRFPFYWDAGMAFLAIPIALTLVETKKQTVVGNLSGLEKILKLIKYSLNDHTEIKWLIIYSSIVGASTLTMVWFIQIFWVTTGVPLGLFGILWASLMFASATISWHAHRIEKKLGKKRSLLALIVFPVVGYFLLSAFPFAWASIFIVLFYVTRGMNEPVMSDYINGLVSSDTRATILSVNSLVGRIIFSIVGPIVGWMSDAFSLQIALALSGLIFLLSGSMALVFMRKHKIM